MKYRILGTGPRLPAPHVRQAQTAAEALRVRDTLRTLYGHAVVQDADGREVDEGELRRIELEEERAARLPSH